MENKDNMNIIQIRRCDLHSVFSMLSLGNKDVVESAWNAVEVMIKK